jgi:hypothetical protein
MIDCPETSRWWEHAIYVSVNLGVNERNMFTTRFSFKNCKKIRRRDWNQEILTPQGCWAINELESGGWWCMWNQLNEVVSLSWTMDWISRMVDTVRNRGWNELIGRSENRKSDRSKDLTGKASRRCTWHAKTFRSGPITKKSYPEIAGSNMSSKHLIFPSWWQLLIHRLQDNFNTSIMSM